MVGQSGLAALLMNQGKYAEAEVLYRRALKGQEETLGPAHPSTLATVGNLAGLLMYQAKYDEAEALYRRALKGQEEALGPSHPDTLLTVGNLAMLLDIKGEAAAAQELRVLYPLKKPVVEDEDDYENMYNIMDDDLDDMVF